MATRDDPFLECRTMTQSLLDKTSTLILSSVFSPDEKYIVTGTQNGRIIIWDIEAVLVSTRPYLLFCHSVH